MNLMEGLLTRRSVRKYDTDKKISKETIRKIIKAAQYSPTAHNKQPWEFLVIDDRDFLAELRHIQRWTSLPKMPLVSLLSAAILKNHSIAAKKMKAGASLTLTAPLPHKA